MRPLARRIGELADTNILNAAVIGVAAVSSYHTPDAWSDWGSYPDVLTQLRYLWHVLVTFGAPNDNH
jgi:hypothetical protein